MFYINFPIDFNRCKELLDDILELPEEAFSGDYLKAFIEASMSNIFIVKTLILLIV